ncbi:hypothetical protein B0J13DRAFT_577107 [Dactylonectria estremocensis]|uniref:Uncharacterized protein n=1 Tax=Dactylonectria estremocensis TaxID=1079267 RepID=A0A9P9D1L0_9HYPO|nr:hypothetical protein B0J13DRAFT_577107 [Dactylonectria estremocensis]
MPVAAVTAVTAVTALVLTAATAAQTTLSPKGTAEVTASPEVTATARAGVWTPAMSTPTLSAAATPWLLQQGPARGRLGTKPLQQ